MSAHERASDPAIEGRAPLLSIESLSIAFEGTPDVVAVRRVDLRVERGRTLALVGESGCGKSLTSLAIMRLLPRRAYIIEGRVSLDGQDLTVLDERALDRLRGRAVAMIFQEPAAALDPVYTIGAHLAEAFAPLALPRAEVRARSIEALRRVGIPAPESRIAAYPHELSGGMKQRAMIAMALASEPKLLLADEPTTALDVTVQAEVLALLRRERDERGLGMILVSHDLGVVAGEADEVAVMYRGEVVERAPIEALFAEPRHPYTRGLLRSIPSHAIARGERHRLPTIGGMVAPLGAARVGCGFRDRCPEALARCATDEPSLERVGSSHVACFLHHDVARDEASA